MFNVKNIKKYYEDLKINLSRVTLDVNNLSGPCVVFGSAPTATLPVGFNDKWTLITANAAQAITDELGCREPDITIMTSAILLNKAIYIGPQKAIEGKWTNHLILIEKNMDFQTAISILKGLKYEYNEHTVITPLQRAKLSKIIYGDNMYRGSGENKMSTGLLSVGIALYLKLTPIVMSGFSFSTGKHGYKDEQNIKRDHLQGDKAAIHYFKTNEKEVYASDVAFAEESGLELWKG